MLVYNSKFTLIQGLVLDQISTIVMLILAIEALNGGISSTNAIVIHFQHFPPAHTHLSNMTVVSNDASWWPLIGLNIFQSYWTVAASIVMVYDWVLTLGQEIELIWVSGKVSLEEKQQNAMNS
ncbi:hypothetical protein BDR04DRAFT_39791 [Suillus decipiens]|nr:hypothetical protein BDR04DRAFT_39791 [Suillus decipiens]